MVALGWSAAKTTGMVVCVCVCGGGGGGGGGAVRGASTPEFMKF